MLRSPYNAPVTRPGPEFPDVAALEGLARFSSASGPTPGECPSMFPGRFTDFHAGSIDHARCLATSPATCIRTGPATRSRDLLAGRPKLWAGRKRHHGALKLSSGEDQATSLPTTLAHADKEKFMDDPENGMSQGQRPEKRLSPSVREVAECL